MKHMKKILPLVVMVVFVLSGLGAVALSNNTSGSDLENAIKESLSNGVNTNTNGQDNRYSTHTVLAEFGTATWCGYCKYAHGALKELYNEGNYDFYYVSLVTDKNTKAYNRCIQDYNIYGYPTVYWDGGYKVNVGAGSIPGAKSAYINSINQCSARPVEDVDVSLEVHWLGRAKMGIEATVVNNGARSYNGHLRVYITEKESSMNWKDSGGHLYTFPFLDYAFDNVPIILSAGETWNDYTEWNGNTYGYSTITPDNIMVIAAVFNDEWHQGYSYPPSSNPFDAYYVDDVTAAEPMTFWADTYTVPADTGGTVNMYLSAGKEYANRNYIILGSVTGTEPGTTLPDGTILPLNWDAFTNIVFNLANTPTFSNFLDTLDNNGNSVAQLNLPPMPDYTGLKMYYAYTLYSPFGYTSNPITITLV